MNKSALLLACVLILAACQASLPATTPAATNSVKTSGASSSPDASGTCPIGDETCASSSPVASYNAYDASSSPEITPQSTASVTSTPDTQIDAADFSQKSGPQSGDTIAIMDTNMGTIKIRLFAELAPKTVENFTTLAKKDYYNGIIFHRVIDGFMIQGGDPTGTGRGGESAWGVPFEDEFSTKLSNIPGSLAMANSGKNTNGSQFFINQVSNNFLDNRHSVFGQVYEGMDVVEKIAKAKTGPNDKPVEDIVIKNIEISTYENE